MSVCLFGVLLCPFVLEGQLLWVIQLDCRLMTLLLSLTSGGIMGRGHHTQLLLVFLGSTVGPISGAGLLSSLHWYLIHFGVEPPPLGLADR